jgi:hypothetical protein
MRVAEVSQNRRESIGAIDSGRPAARRRRSRDQQRGGFGEIWTYWIKENSRIEPGALTARRHRRKCRYAFDRLWREYGEREEGNNTWKPSICFPHGLSFDTQLKTAGNAGSVTAGKSSREFEFPDWDFGPKF